MSHPHSPETGLEEINSPDPSAALSETVDYNEAAAEQTERPANPQATALMEQHASMFGHDAERFGTVQNTQYTTIDGRTMAIDTTNLRNAQALKQAAGIQERIDGEAADTMAEAEAMVGANSAEIPPSEPESQEVAALDNGYQAEADVASAEIATINGGVAEEMNNALVSV